MPAVFCLNDFEQFVERVSKACDNVDGKFLSVSYPNEDLAVILYRWSNGLHYKQLFENDDFKELTVTDWWLEHVSIGDKYWYSEDLKL